MSTRKEILNRLVERSAHNLLSYSSNYLMTKSKKGREKEWRMAKEECEVLSEILQLEQADESRAKDDVQDYHFTGDISTKDLDTVVDEIIKAFKMGPQT